ncbi:hypothetical protein G7Z17_g3479 [Cylindrodendrum hubeiense]|uniref:Uncharacterized protein n=1 Tax=Cylindrodendrum hubeiense TaxID=595255 RepID=A0A9P5HHS4_9HYPO|nr:hypothetical protein G7Z17_g3479 [Cylindrodendrum hubeiense]
MKQSPQVILSQCLPGINPSIVDSGFHATAGRVLPYVAKNMDKIDRVLSECPLELEQAEALLESMADDLGDDIFKREKEEHEHNNDQHQQIPQPQQVQNTSQTAMNRGQTPEQMQNRTPDQMGQRNPNMAGQMDPQPGAAGNAGQQRQVRQRRPSQIIAFMDSMDLPPQVLAQLGLPPEVKKWGTLEMWLDQHNVAQPVRNQLYSIQDKQFQLVLQRGNQQQHK